ncbi:dihydrofolate reductase [Marmoricola sp. URHA0025 HA25]
MGSLIVTNIVSLDGFDRDAEGSPLALNMDGAFDSYNLERIRGAAAVLLGATSYQMFSSFWPFVADAPDDPANPALSPTNREFSRIYNQVPKILVSDGFEPAHENPWTATTTRVRRADVAAWIGEQRRSDDGDLVVFASRTTWNGLLRDGLVDEVHLVVSPRTLGAGGAVFDDPVELRLLGARALDGSDNVLLRYAPRGT